MTPRLRAVRWTMLALLGGVVCVAGCHDPRAEKASARRMARIHTLLAQAKDDEEAAVGRLERTANLIRDTHERHKAQLRRDLAQVRRWHEDDVRQWEDRQPLYRHWVTSTFSGDLEGAYTVLPWLFY